MQGEDNWAVANGHVGQFIDGGLGDTSNRTGPHLGGAGKQVERVLMDYKLPVKVAEIHLTYNNTVKAKDRPRVLCSRDAYWILESNWGVQMGLLETFNILLLDRSNRAMALCPISKGGISGTVVDLKIVFAAALKGRASAIILAHNHPSGNLRPSREDIELTQRFREAGKLLGIQVVDHLILSPDGGYYSFGDEMQIGG